MRLVRVVLCIAVQLALVSPGWSADMGDRRKIIIDQDAAGPAGSDQQKAWADSSGYGSYFEVLDCSWHAGQDPRPHGPI